MTDTSAPPRTTAKSVSAVARAFIVVFALSLGTDQILHMLKVYPPWGEPMYDSGLLALALAYRIVYGVLGGYVAARFAPRNPMRHAMIVGYIGLAFSAMGVIASLNMPQLGPLWYPIAILLTAVPCAWAGGMLRSRRPSAA